ncbi:MULTISPECIES: FxLYD domain-containing protein [Enterobacterales]|uniref:FxLYD domain-containing protein n=1 Tax=Enterobacterales TaxID=91347 RepID=UPI0005541EF0|nr:FxLYD domain-containing protein [Erwinia oleae]
MKRKLSAICFAAAFITSSAALAATSNKVAVSDLHFQKTQNGLQNIQGLGQNTSGKTLGNIIVKFNLLKNDVVIGQAVDMASNIEPGQKFTINAIYNSIQLQPDSFKLTEVLATEK